MNVHQAINHYRSEEDDNAQILLILSGVCVWLSLMFLSSVGLTMVLQ